MINKKLFLIVIGISIILNIFLFLKLNNESPQVKEENRVESLTEKYPLLAKRILYDLPVDVVINFLDLRTNLRAETASWGDSFGMYFEYLPTGTSININGNSEFYAASLFKTPVIMAYYHTKYRLGKNNDPEVAITKESIDKEFGNLWKKGEGYKIKLSEAVRLALEESDNTAAKLITPYIGATDFQAVYQGLDIDLNSDSEGAILTAKNYSSILKALYFSSVLDFDSSQEILKYLTQTIFPDKMVAGIPNSIKVAHKIGDFIDSNDNNQAYMDCGIVYYTRRPYLLCMMSKTDEQLARARMADISKIIYDYIDNIR